MKKIAADRNYRLRKKAFDSNAVWGQKQIVTLDLGKLETMMEEVHVVDSEFVRLSLSNWRNDVVSPAVNAVDESAD
jgi:hypothetical protein